MHAPNLNECWQLKRSESSSARSSPSTMFLERVYGLCSLYALYDIMACLSTKLSSLPSWRSPPHQSGGDSQGRLIEVELKRFFVDHSAGTIVHSIFASANDKLFNTILHSYQHIFFHMFPPLQDTLYTLRIRSHNLQFPTRKSSLTIHLLHFNQYVGQGLSLYSNLVQSLNSLILYSFIWLINWTL